MVLVVDDLLCEEYLTIAVGRDKSAAWNLMSRNGIFDCCLEVGGHIDDVCVNLQRIMVSFVRSYKWCCDLDAVLPAYYT